MPSPIKPGHTRMLVQVPTDIQAKADARRRRERTTWSRVISTLLDRWGNGDDAGVAKPVRLGRPATPDAEEAERLHQHWMATDEAYRRACSERIDPATLTWYRSPAALFAATARREGRTVAPEIVAAAAAELDDGDADG